MNSPTPEEIRRLRESAGLNRKDAAALIYQSVRSWEKLEIGERVMQLALWDLFQRKVEELETAKKFAEAAKRTRKSRPKKRSKKR